MLVSDGLSQSYGYSFFTTFINSKSVNLSFTYSVNFLWRTWTFCLSSKSLEYEFTLFCCVLLGHPLSMSHIHPGFSGLLPDSHTSCLLTISQSVQSEHSLELQRQLLFDSLLKLIKPKSCTKVFTSFWYFLSICIISQYKPLSCFVISPLYWKFTAMHL